MKNKQNTIIDIDNVIAWCERQPKFADYGKHLVPEEIRDEIKGLKEYTKPLTVLTGLHIIMKPLGQAKDISEVCRLAPMAIPYGFATVAKLNRGLIDALVRHLYNPTKSLEHISKRSSSNIMYAIVQMQANTPINCLYAYLFDHYFDATKDLVMPEVMRRNGNALARAIIDTLELVTAESSKSLSPGTSNTERPKFYEN